MTQPSPPIRDATNVAPASLPDGLAPDWRLGRDEACLACAYNLRGLREPRCPECGAGFRWQRLLAVRCPRCDESLADVDADHCPECKLALNWGRVFDEAPTIDRKSFERTDKPLRKFPGFLLSMLLPWRFWSRVRIESQPNVRRLRRARSWAVAASIAILAMCGWSSYERLKTGWGTFLWGGTHDEARLHILLDQTTPAATLWIPPLITLIGAPLFMPTLAQHRIRRDQMVRVTACLAIGMLWGALFIGGATLIGAAVDWYNPGGASIGPFWAMCDDSIFSLAGLGASVRYGGFSNYRYEVFSAIIIAVAFLVSFVWANLFAIAGLRRYLKLPWRDTLAVVGATQCIALLLLTLFICQSPAAGDLMQLVFSVR